MTPTKSVETNGTINSSLKDSSTTATASGGPNAYVIPDWINEDNFAGVLEQNFKGFKKILNFEVAKTGGAGENYASVMLRVKTKIELEDGSTTDVPFMIKTVPQGGEGAQLISEMGIFPKESSMYGSYLREFEQMYADVGKEVTLGPRSFSFKNDPGAMYVLLEDISPAGFKNVDRLKCLDRDHTESVLKILAQLHAASALRYVTKGEYEDSLKTFIFHEGNRDQLADMMVPLVTIMKETFSKFEGVAKYLHILGPILDEMVDLYISVGKYDPNEFNVIVHGDLWSNNIMFRHNDEGKREQTILVDFQMSRYASPAMDLFYFLLSSPSLDIKLSNFDDFVKLYHDHLIDNLKLLNYPKKLPTLKQLHMELLAHSAMGLTTITGVLGVMLLDPSENASVDSFFDEGEQATSFRRQLYENPRYIKQLEAILPWMYKRGYLESN